MSVVLPHVVHVSSAHPWTDNRIHYRECATLAAAGFPVTLIAVEADVDAPVGDVEVIRIPQLTRLRRFLISSPRAVRLALKTKAKIVHLHDPELAWAVPVLRALGRSVVFDAHEDLPADVLSKPYLPRWAKPPLGVFARVVVWLGSRANRVVAATEIIAERFPESKTVVVHNYPPLRQEEAAADIVRGDVAVYIGAMSKVRGTRELLAAAAAPSFPEGWKLAIAGSGTPEVVDDIFRASGEANIICHSQLPPDDARQLLLEAKVGIVALQATRAHMDSLPTKMFEYFAAGLPVIASDFPLWRGIVVEEDCGFVVDETSPDAIADAVARYDREPELWEKHSQNARNLAVNRFNWSPEGELLVELYRSLV